MQGPEHNHPGDPSTPQRPAPTSSAPTASTAKNVRSEEFVLPGSGIFQLTEIDGRYRLLRVIGRGGMGTVYLAQQREPSRLVAVKLLPGPLEHADAVARFRREAQLVSQLSHPGIAHVYEAGTCDTAGGSTPYYVMEYVEAGAPLTDAAVSRNLDLRSRIELFCLVCDAAHHAHERGVLHRDLKPANILVGADGRPRIIDFGIARAPAGMAPITIGDATFGTPAYMSPEQLRASAAVDRRSDVYALGVILFELLCGERPYTMSGGLLEGRMAIDVVRVKPPRDLNPDLPEELVPVLLTALAKDADDRYATAALLADDLRRWLSGAVPAARSPSVIARARSSARAFAARRPLLTFFAVGAGAAIVAEFVGVPIFHDLTSVSDRWSAALCAAFAPSSPAGMKNVVVIAVDDPGILPALASELGIADVDADQPTTWRPLHGALMQRLARAGPRVVAWDVVFAGESADASHDQALAEGASALLATNAELVTSFYSWSPGGRGSPETLSKPLVKALSADDIDAARWGGISGKWSADKPWSLTLAVKREDGAVLPSISLRAYAAWLAPHTQPGFSLPDEESVAISFRRRDPSVSGTQSIARPDATIPIFGVGSSDEPDFGLSPAAQVAQLPIALPDDQTIAASTLTYSQAMHADTTALRARVRDRAVLIANTSIAADVWPHPGNRHIAGVYAHAAALDALIDARTLHQSGTLTFLLVPAASFSGAFIGLASFGRRLVAAVCVVMLLAALGAASVWAWSAQSLIVSPFVPAIGLIAAAVLAAWIAPRRAARLVIRVPQNT